MKFVKQEIFRDYKGNPKKAGPDLSPSDPERNAWNGEVLGFIADQYVPQQTLQLTVGEIRKLNKAIQVCQGEAHEGWYQLEDEDFGVLKKVVEHMVLLMPGWARSAPEVEDMLAETTARLPKELDNQPSKNGLKLKEPVEA